MLLFYFFYYPVWSVHIILWRTQELYLCCSQTSRFFSILFITVTEAGGDWFLGSVGNHLQDYTVTQLRSHSRSSPPWEPLNSRTLQMFNNLLFGRWCPWGADTYPSAHELTASLDIKVSSRCSQSPIIGPSKEPFQYSVQSLHTIYLPFISSLSSHLALFPSGFFTRHSVTETMTEHLTSPRAETFCSMWSS
jgi:hypothetical protein